VPPRSNTTASTGAAADGVTPNPRPATRAGGLRSQTGG
jgi:hypothetical protein